MKYLITIIVLLVGLSFTALAQENVNSELKGWMDEFDKDCAVCDHSNTLVYDASCKSFWQFVDGKWDIVRNPKKLGWKYNEMKKIRVVNLNRYLYNVSIETEDIAYESEVPELLLTSFPNASGLLQNAAGSLSANIAGVAEGAVGEAMAESGLTIKGAFGDGIIHDPYTVAITSFADTLVLFQKEIVKLEEAEINAYSICPPQELKCCKDNEVDYAELANLFNVLQASYFIADASITNVINTEDGLKAKKEAAKAAKAACKTPDGKTAVWLDELAQLEKKKPSKLSSKEKKRLKELREEKGNWDKAVQECEHKMDAKVIEIEFALGKIQALKKNQVELKALWDNIVKPLGQNLKRLALFKKNFTKESYSYTSPPIFPTSERMGLSIHISPNEHPSELSLAAAPSYNDSLRLEIRVRNRLQVDFSTGSFVGFGKNLFSERFGWREVADANSMVTDTSGYMLTDLGRSKIAPFGFAAFANIGVKLTDFIGLGASFGVGSTVEKRPKPAFLGGFNLGFGKKHLVNLSIGLLATPVEYLNTALYDETAVYQNPPTLDYDWKWQVGGYVGISYTIFNTAKRRKAKGSSVKKLTQVEPSTSSTETSTETEEGK